MKRKYIGKLFTAFFVLSPLLLLVSCNYFETSDNGDLDGFWHLERIDTLETGGVNDLSQSRLFWGFQYKLVSIKDADGVYGSFYMRFSHENGTLRLHSPYRNQWHENDEGEGGDIPVEDSEALAPFGIQGLEDTFDVEKLNGSKMVLKSEKFRLRLRKF